MINEYDVVQAKRNLSQSILKGSRGAVLMIFDEPNLAYEVEFVDEEGETIDIITVYPNDLEVIRGYVIVSMLSAYPVK